MRQLFPSFDGPVRGSPYFCAPRKRRWWPLAFSFGAGVGCVLLVSWEQAALIAEPKPTAIQWTSLPPEPVDAAPTTTAAAVPADTPQQATSNPSPDPAPPAEVRPADNPPAQAETPMPTARPRPAAAVASAAPQHQARAKLTGGGTAESRNFPARTNIRTANAAPPAAIDQGAGMVRIDEEELPDGRRVPLYRWPTIFDGVR